MARLDTNHPIALYAIGAATYHFRRWSYVRVNVASSGIGPWHFGDAAMRHLCDTFGQCVYVGEYLWRSGDGKGQSLGHTPAQEGSGTART